MQTKSISHVMNTNITTLTKVTIGAIAFISLTLMALNHTHTDVLPLLGVGVSYLAALAILGLAAFDKGSAKRLN